MVALPTRPAAVAAASSNGPVVVGYRVEPVQPQPRRPPPARPSWHPGRRCRCWSASRRRGAARRSPRGRRRRRHTRSRSLPSRHPPTVSKPGRPVRDVLAAVMRCGNTGMERHHGGFSWKWSVARRAFLADRPRGREAAVGGGAAAGHGAPPSAVNARPCRSWCWDWSSAVWSSVCQRASCCARSCAGLGRPGAAVPRPPRAGPGLVGRPPPPASAPLGGRRWPWRRGALPGRGAPAL